MTIELMKPIQFFIILFTIFSFVGCASQPDQREKMEIKEQFAPFITDNGLKIFVYTVSMSGGESNTESTADRGSRSGSRSGGGGSRRGGSRDGGGTQSKQRTTDNGFKDKIAQKLLAKLIETGYCREGYIELSSSIGRGESSIRGECKEGATEEDRKNFLPET